MLRALGPISAPCLSVHCKDWSVSVSLVMLVGNCLAHFSGVQGLMDFFYPGTLEDYVVPGIKSRSAACRSHVFTLILTLVNFCQFFTISQIVQRLKILFITFRFLGHT